MSYATLPDLEGFIDNDRLIRLTDDDDTGAVVPAVVEAVLEAASTEIDSYLAAQCTLPRPEPYPALLVKLCVDIGGFLLHIRREEAPGQYWDRQYETAIKTLERIAAGELSVCPDSSGASAHAVTVSGPVRVFNRDNLTGF